MRPGWLLAALLLLSGCTLGSDDSLIVVSDMPAQMAGHYELYTEGPVEVPAAWETKMVCLDPANVPVPAEGVRYCAFPAEEDRGGTPRFLDIAPNGKAFAIRDPDRASLAGDDKELRFLGLGEGMYLAQFYEGSRFHLWIARMSGIGIEIYALGCDDFPKGTRPYHPYGGTFGPPCSAISLDALRPGLDAYAAKIKAGRRAPFAILKRL
ncbi:hypothetical protein OF829_03690 [Sphingomonas sp. LB-2]|uniref:hypothetical protein n=1 Tax=Sphingomonas caeni TaxID=2984949 RepID=UPI00222F1025|nr:hypothetical protein [Sphingomonas caeni]MCW3846329.1 hypothetical protein [Sphingomonas caeni]